MDGNEPAITKAPETAIPEITATPMPSESSRIFDVHNYAELLAAAGSDREIRLFPGDYDPVSFNGEEMTFDSVKNLTLTGVPDEGKDYVSFTTSSGHDNVLNFKNCSEITIRNLDIGHTVRVECHGNVADFTECKNISIENCRLFGCGQTGLVVKDVEHLYMQDSLIEDCSYASLEVTGESNYIRFIGCTLRDQDLNIWNFGHGVDFDHCKILSPSGILSIRDPNYPLSYSTGYESDWGTEDWNPDQSLFAVYYSRFDQSTGMARYTDTYNGNEAFYNDGRFMKLVEAVQALSDQIVLSVDQDLKDESKLTLKVHFMDGGGSGTMNSFIKRILALEPAMDEIKALNMPVMFVLHGDPRDRIAVIEYTPENLAGLMDDKGIHSVTGASDVLLFPSANALSVGPYEMGKSNDELTGFVTTDYPLGSPSEPQSIHYLFSSLQSGIVWDYYSIDSFAGRGDFTHYKADLIFKINDITGHAYLLDQNGAYAVRDTSPETVNSLKNCVDHMDGTLKGKLDGDVSLVVPLEQINPADYGHFQIYIQAVKRLEPSDNFDMEYEYHHFIATIDLSTWQVTDLQPYRRVEYRDRYKQDEPLFFSFAYNVNPEPIVMPASFSEEGGYVYFTNHFEGSHIFRIKKDGSDMREVVADKAAYLTVKDGWVYYAYPDRPLKKCRIDGTGAYVFGDTCVSGDIKVVDGWIYYVSVADRGSIVGIKTDGSGRRVLLSNQFTDKMFILDGWIYFNRQYGEGNTSYPYAAKMKIDGSEYQPIKDKYTMIAWIDPTGIYYWECLQDKPNDAFWTLNRMKLDGTGSESLYPCYSFENDGSGNAYYIYDNLYCRTQDGTVSALLGGGWTALPSIDVLDSVVACSIPEVDGKPQKIIFISKDKHDLVSIIK